MSSFGSHQRGVIPSAAAFQAERGISLYGSRRDSDASSARPGDLHPRSLTRLKCAGFRDDAV